ncbi:TPA: hypothetical protein JLP73_003520 [Escherichia coli]|nr:hypothetical protein [Escherichia coli]HAW2477759.1 hypothetical protein [Escherichia coli]
MQSYSSMTLKDSDTSRLALNIIRQHLGGLPVGQARLVLRKCEFMIDATMFVDCETNEFQRAFEGFQNAD